VAWWIITLFPKLRFSCYINFHIKLLFNSFTCLSSIPYLIWSILPSLPRFNFSINTIHVYTIRHGESLFPIRHHRQCSASTWSPPAVTDSGHCHCHILAAVLWQSSLLSAPSSPNSSYRLPLTVFTAAIHSLLCFTRSYPIWAHVKLFIHASHNPYQLHQWF
jgi:hypothetical protein